MTGDERWACYVAVPALVASLPVYVIAVGYYWTCREGFATFLAFVEGCEGLVLGQDHADDEAAA